MAQSYDEAFGRCKFVQHGSALATELRRPKLPRFQSEAHASMSSSVWGTGWRMTLNDP